MAILECPNPYTGCKTPEGICARYWFSMLWDRVMSLYEWKGKDFEGTDATLNADYLEYTLMTQGEAAFIKDKKGLLRGLRCSRIGLDPYNFPLTLLATNPVLGNLQGKVNKDCVWIRNNKFATPTIETIKYYATQLAKVQISLNVSLSNNRMTKVFLAESDEQAQAIRKMVDDIDGGKLAVIQKPDIFTQIMGGADSSNNGIPVYSTPSEYLADKYLENMREILNDFYTTFGVNSSGANMIKHERNLSSEVNSNNQQIMINRVYWLEPRQKAAELASELFGTEITVDLREEDIDIYSDLNEQMVNKEEEPNE
nr:MAG TPA: upper collar protein [Bacteriophage sp.]